MTVGSIGGNTNTGANSVGMNQQGMDSYSKNLQNQITQAQKQLQELAKNDEMDPETKMKKRQEIQKQISNLNSQLRQHQMEERKKAQQKKEQKNHSQKSEQSATGLSKNSMEAMISADNSLKQAKIQGDTANQLQNSADIKRAEIARDGGGSQRSSGDSAAISSKWDDVESMEQHAQTATASQVSTLAEAQSKLSEANAEGSNSTSAKAEEKGEQKAKAEGEAATIQGTEIAEAAGVTVSVAEPETAPTELTSTSTSTKKSVEIGSTIDVKV